MAAGIPAIALTAIGGGINRLRTKGAADKNSLYDLLNAYVTQSNTIKVRPGTFRVANIAAFSSAGATKGLVHYNGQFHTFSASVVSLPPSGILHVLVHPSASDSVIYPIKEIHYASPYLGGLYVVAEFTVPTAIAAAVGTVFHYWIQFSDSGDNQNIWLPNTQYEIGDVVIPSTPNGLTYIASRLKAANPTWTANTQETAGNIVEPTVPNGFKYTVTNTEGATPSTGATEPTWPLQSGATVSENSALAIDQTVTLATPASTTPTPTTPGRYLGLYTPPT